MVGPTSMKDMQRMFLDYEVSSSAWAYLVWWDWGQDICARYYAWKVRRKYSRYMEFLRIKYERTHKK